MLLVIGALALTGFISADCFYFLGELVHWVPQGGFRMVYGVTVIMKYLLGIDVAGRDMAVYRDDTFVVSFPRSGNTWARFLIANLMFPEQQVSFANIERLIPDTSSQSNRALKRTPRPRIIKSHEYFDARYPKVIYIVRDPRDVALSYHNFMRKYRHIEDGFPLDKYVSGFISGNLNNWGTWGTWGENVGSWLGACLRRPNFLLLRYEDAKRDTFGELSKIASFMGIAASQEQLTAAIKASSPERMRELEKSQSQEWVATKNKRSDIPFVGAAEVGNWKKLLSKNSIAEIESVWGDLMIALGYQLAEVDPGTFRNSTWRARDSM